MRGARRRRGARRAVAGLAVAALLAAAWAWWAAQPEPPAVREEANRLPVAWYAEGQLHLEDVVVELPEVEVFVAPRCVARRGRPAALGRGGAGGLGGRGRAVDDSARRPRTSPPWRRPSAASACTTSWWRACPWPAAGWAHLLDSARQAGARTPCGSRRPGVAPWWHARPNGRARRPGDGPRAGGTVRLR